MNLTPYRFMVRGFVILLPVLVSVLMMEAFLWRLGETVPIRHVALGHDRNGPPAAYAPWFIGHQFNLLQHERVKRLRPNLLVLGSSHVSRFRHEMFGADADFYNSCQAIESLGDLEQYVAALPPDYSPQTVLLGLDHWWFNAALGQSGTFAKGITRDDTLDPSAHLYAYSKLLKGLLQGMLDLSESRGNLPAPLAVDILVGRDGGLKRYGLGAWKGVGLRNDGSNQSEDRTMPKNHKLDLPGTTEEVLKISGDPLYASGASADEELMRRCVTALTRLEKRGTRIVAFIPPLASDVRQLYESHPDHFGLYANFRARMAALFAERGWYLIDGSAPERFGLDDRCMKDLDHALETYHIALLREMAKDAQVRQALHLDPAYLQALLDDPRTTPWYPIYPKPTVHTEFSSTNRLVLSTLPGREPGRDERRVPGSERQ